MGVKIILTNGNEHFIPDVNEVTDKVVEELAKQDIETMVADSLVENRSVISSIVEQDCFSTGSGSIFETAVIGIVNDPNNPVLDSSNEILQNAVRTIANVFCFSTTDGSSSFGPAVESIIDGRESDLIDDLTGGRTSNKADVYLPAVTILTDAALPTTGKTGDYCIIKDTKAGTQTAYMYLDGRWEALNGNYSANNVYFDEDIEITKEIGYITLDNTGAGIIPAKDKNLVDVFGEMFAQDKDPRISQPKIDSFTFSNAGKSFEVGTKLTNLNFAASFYAGNYQYGPEDTGIIPSWEIKQGNTVISQEASGTIAELVIADDTKYVLKAIASYEQGAIPLTFKKKEKAELRIAAGSVDASTSAITGYRKYYYGPIYSKINPTTDLTSELIKGLLNKSTSNCSNKTTITWKAANYEGIVGYIIAVPANNNTVINRVGLLSNSDQTITDTYESYVTLENICGAGDDAGVKYNVWLYQPNILGNDEEHSITFKNN